MPQALDVTQALRDAENALRDFIAAELMSKLGTGWEERAGVSPERVTKWKERRDVEQKRQETGVVDERLIYYADFFDLKPILKKNWQGIFSEALGDWKTLDVYLTELERLRDPDAHRRELLPHQKYLILGISGEIRTRLVRYRSKMETQEDCFPRIESVRDSLGNIWVPGDIIRHVDTRMTLRPGDTIDFVISASDPENLPLEYGVRDESIGQIHWGQNDTFSVTLEDKHIGTSADITLFVRSGRPYHASGAFDDRVAFYYTVLPRRGS
jgi:hypothetical protein